MTTLAQVEDDNWLYTGIKNLATTYFDTTAIHNKAAEESEWMMPSKTNNHFDFQTVKDLTWADAVNKIMGSKHVKDFVGDGTALVKKAMKMGLAEVAGETATTGQTLINFITDQIVDRAQAAFASRPPVQEVFEPGTWLYVSRGKQQTVQNFEYAMAAEVSLFQDGDEIMIPDFAQEMFSPGFYVNHVSQTNQHVVYVFDAEKPITVDFETIRPATPEDKKRWDDDPNLTLVRELFFLRENKDAVEYAKFQVGDEVLFKDTPYVVRKIDAMTAVLKDDSDNIIKVDPQACTRGEPTHWKSQRPGQFRTAQFTFSPGDFAYRKIQSIDSVPKRATAILTCIRRLATVTGRTMCNCVDVWTGQQIQIDPRVLVKPPLPTRSLLDKQPAFHTFQLEVLNGYDQSTPGELHTQENKHYCYGYGMRMVFPETPTVQTEDPVVEPELVQEEVIVVPDAEPPQTEASPIMLPLAVCLAVGFLIFSQ